MTRRDDHESEHCQELLERLSMYLDGDLPEAERRRVGLHLRDCPDCEEILAGLRQTIEICHEEGHPPLPEPLRAKARERVQEMLARLGARAGRSHKRPAHES